jgi:hypothetical protein
LTWAQTGFAGFTGLNLKPILDAVQRFPRLVFSFFGSQDVAKIFPHISVGFKIEHYCLLFAPFVNDEFNTPHKPSPPSCLSLAHLTHWFKPKELDRIYRIHGIFGFEILKKNIMSILLILSDKAFGLTGFTGF